MWTEGSSEKNFVIIQLIAFETKTQKLALYLVMLIQGYSVFQISETSYRKQFWIEKDLQILSAFYFSYCFSVLSFAFKTLKIVVF